MQSENKKLKIPIMLPLRDNCICIQDLRDNYIYLYMWTSSEFPTIYILI